MCLFPKYIQGKFYRNRKPELFCKMLFSQLENHLVNKQAPFNITMFLRWDAWNLHQLAFIFLSLYHLFKLIEHAACHRMQTQSNNQSHAHLFPKLHHIICKSSNLFCLKIGKQNKLRSSVKFPFFLFKTLPLPIIILPPLPQTQRTTNWTCIYIKTKSTKSDIILTVSV